MAIIGRFSPVALYRLLSGKFRTEGKERLSAQAPRSLVVIKPQIVLSKARTLGIMREPVTVAMFRQFVEDEASKPNGYRIVGHNAGKLTALLADRSGNNRPVTSVSYRDAEAFVAWRNEKTGETFLLPSESTYNNIQLTYGAKLINRSRLSEWTHDTYIYDRSRRILCSLGGASYHAPPDARNDEVTFRLECLVN